MACVAAWRQRLRPAAARAGTRRSRSRPSYQLGERRHRPGRVLGQHGHDRVDVAALHRVDVALARSPRSSRVAERAQRRLLALLGQPLVERLAGALQRAVDRGDRRVERLGDLACREAEHVAQDQHRALARRELLERGDERQLDALALLVARLRRGEPSSSPRLASGYGSSQTDSSSGGSVPSCGSAGRPVVDGQHRASAAARSRSGRRWSRSGTARRAASCGPRSAAARARRAAARPAARPRRRAPSRACGSSARAARARCGSTRRPKACSSPPPSRREQRSLPFARSFGCRAHPRERRPPRAAGTHRSRFRDESSVSPGSCPASTRMRRSAHVAAQLVVAAERQSRHDRQARSTTSRPSSRAGRDACASACAAAPEALSVEFRAVKAAVCHGFGEPLVVEEHRARSARGPARCGCAWPPARSATATSPTPRAPGAGACPPSTGTRRRASSRRWAAQPGGLAPGDHVVVTLVRSCGTCHVCRRGQPALCETAFALDERSPLRTRGGAEIAQGLRTGGVRRAGARPPLPGRRRPARAAARPRVPAGLRRRHRLRRGASTRRR